MRVLAVLAVLGALLAAALGALLASPRLQGLLVYCNWLYVPTTDLSRPQEASFLFAGLPRTRAVAAPGPDGEPLGVWVTEPDPACGAQPRGTLLYHHGNAETKAWSWGVAKAAYFSSTAECLRVVTFDYRGFGDSPGVPTEAGLVRDAAAVFEFVVRDLGEAPGRVVVHGHSLGTGVSTQAVLQLQERGLAPAALVLEAPFTSIAAVAASFVPLRTVEALLDEHLAHRFDTAARIRDVRVPLCLLHGTADGIVPFEHSGELLALTRRADSRVPAVRYFAVQGGGHDTMLEDAAYREGMKECIGAALVGA